MKTTYEWVAEPVDKNGDIIDPIFGDTFEEVCGVEVSDFEGAVRINIALVRNTGDEESGLNERQYAYLKGGILTEFDGGASIPNRFNLTYLYRSTTTIHSVAC
jgi:hypothetical protein